MRVGASFCCSEASCFTWLAGSYQPPPAPKFTSIGVSSAWLVVVESFFSSLKKERVQKRIYKTRDLARADVFDYIEVFYNRSRRPNR